MKTITLLSVFLLSCCLSMAQANFKITEMQVLSYDREAKEYAIEQDWVPYDAVIKFDWKTMAIYSINEESKGLNHTCKIGKIESIKDNYLVETSAWFIDGTDMECMIVITYLDEGIEIEYFINEFVFKYRAKLY
jgi:hypothetical protein